MEYTIKKMDFNSKNSDNISLWNPYEVLEQLEKNDPIKYISVIKELEKTLKQSELRGEK